MNIFIMNNRGFRLMFILACLVLFTSLPAAGQDTGEKSSPAPHRINFIVSPRQKKIDGAPLSFQVQTLLMQLQLQAVVVRKIKKSDFFVIIPGSSKEMADLIIRILKRRHAMIGDIWFDSHGHFQRRRSLFEIGEEEFNCRSIHDSMATIYLKRLSAYCDTDTRVGIGSCYGGATYSLPAVEIFPAKRMNGDSLMIGVSDLLNHATVYASESFVMTSLGIMHGGYAMAGIPTRKKFRDPIYEPVWEKAGEWNCYSGKEGKFVDPVTVSLKPDGSIYTNKRTWLSYKKNQRKLARKLKQFKRGNYNLSPLYQESAEADKKQHSN